MCTIPILFSTFINDLIVELRSSGCGIDIDGVIKIASLLYADDVVVLANSEKELQQLLSIVNQWCLKWGINVNPTKTKAIYFRHKRRKISCCQLMLGSSVIEFCHEYEYLGYWINEFLDVNESLNRVFVKANAALGVIIAKSMSLGGIPFDVFTKLYKTCFTYFLHTLLTFGHSVPPNMLSKLRIGP